MALAKKGLLKGLAFSGAVLLASQAGAATIALSEYNLVVEGDYTHLGGSVWGTAFIGGDILGGASEFAVAVPNSAEIDSLQVVGNIEASHVKVKSGNLVIGGDINPSSHVELHGTGASIIHDDSLSIDPIITELREASTYYESLATNTSFSNGQFSYSGADDTAVFSGSWEDIFAQNTQFNFSDVNAENIVINVSGINVAPSSSYNFPGFDKEGTSGLGASNILWNFYEAETLDLGSTNFMGSILAMNAHVSVNGTLEGSLAASSVISQRQIHDYYYEGEVSEVPLPAGVYLFATALAGLGFFRKKANKKAA